MASGIQVNAARKGGCTALMYASEKGRTAAIDALVANGAKVNATDKSGFTALFYAAGFGGHTAAIDALVANGAEVNVVDNECGMTALMWAEAYPEAVEALKRHGAV